MNELVAVEVRETIEEPERIIFSLAVSSLKRLLVLHDFLVIRPQLADSFHDCIRKFPADTAPKIVGVFEDRELDMVIDNLVVVSHKIASHVIQSGALIVEDFSD
jgi:hypothetical protein